MTIATISALKKAARQLRWLVIRMGCIVSSCAVMSSVQAQTVEYEPPKQMTLSPTGVNLADFKHKYTYKTTDLSIGPFSLERSYLDGHEIKGSDYFGRNWTHNYAAHVSEGEPSKRDQTIVVIGRSSVRFTKTTDAPTGFSTSNPDAVGTTLEIVGGAFVYTDRQGSIYTFNASVNAFSPLPGRRNQRIARIDYADGHTLIYRYDGSSKLTQISSNYGYSLVFEYGASGYVSKACGYNRALSYVTMTASCAGAAPTVSYTYLAAVYVNVTNVTDVLGQNWGYSYDGSSNVSKLICVKQVNSSNCLISNTYPEDGIEQTMADGAIWSYSYILPDPSDPQQPGEPPVITSGGYYGPEGIIVGATFGAGLLDAFSESSVGGPSRTTTLKWDGAELASLTHQEGNKVGYIRDARQNVTGESWTAKPGSNTPSVSRSSVFPDSQLSDCTSVVRKICNKPMSKTDYNGNTTDFTYDPAHGGVLTETAPAVGGIRAQKRFFYAQRYAWVSDGAGGFVQAATPLWLLVEERMCRSSATIGNGCASGVGDEVVTAYDYGPDSGPNTLLLRGTLITSSHGSRRVCYGYDWQGNRISETSPRAGLTACP